jgi:predicted sulfurtransferase
LRALSESNSGAWKGKDRPKGIYQLRGGIQKYLETYGTEQQQSNTNPETNDITAPELESDKSCLYRGKNFVFDPRRTDPIIGEGIANDDASATQQLGQLSLVGRCIICASPHDDYDNGHVPAEEKEARCCRCRVLVLVCNNCRQRTRCWGELEHDGKMDLYCGKSGAECVDEGNVAEKVEITQY